MTSRRDTAALAHLVEHADKAHPARVARVRADLEAEASLATAEAEARARAGDSTGAATAMSIAAAITRIYKALDEPGSGDEPTTAMPGEARKADRPSRTVPRPVRSEAEGDSVRTGQ